MSENERFVRLTERLVPIVAEMMREKVEVELTGGLSDGTVESAAYALLYAKEVAPLYGIDPETLQDVVQAERLAEAIEADPTATRGIDEQALLKAAEADGRFERAVQEIRDEGLVGIEDLEPEINACAGRQALNVAGAWHLLLLDSADANGGALEAARLDEAMLPDGLEDDDLIIAMVSNAVVNDIAVLFFEEREEETLRPSEFREILARFARTLAPDETLPAEMLALLAEDEVKVE